MLTEPPTDTKAKTMSRRGWQIPTETTTKIRRERVCVTICEMQAKDAYTDATTERNAEAETGGDADAASDVASALINVSAALGDTLCLQTMPSFRR